jgi:hypothetical protein
MFWKKKETTYSSPNPAANAVAKSLAKVDDNTFNPYEPNAALKEATNDRIANQKPNFIPKDSQYYFRIDLHACIQERVFSNTSVYCLTDVLNSNCYETQIEAERARLILLEKIEKIKKTIK